MKRSFLQTLGVPEEHRTTALRHTFAWALMGVFVGGAVQQLGFIVRKTGGSPFLVALVTAGPHASALFTVFYATLLERHPARAIVATCRTIFAALFLLAVAVPAPAGLAIMGLAAVVAAKVGDTFYGRLLAGMYPPSLRGRLQSLPLFAQALALAGASTLAGGLLTSHETAFRWLLPVLAPVGMAAALLILRFPTPAVGEQPAREGRVSFVRVLREVARDRPFLRWTLIYTVPNLGFWLVYASLPVYFASVLRFDYWQNGVTLAAFNAAYCLGFLVWGRVLDRARSVSTMVGSWSLVGVGTLVTAVLPSWPAAIVGQAISGFALAGNDIAWYPAVLEFAPEHRVDRYMSLYMTAVGVRALLGGAVGGALMEASDGGSRTALLIAALLMAAGSAGMFHFGRRVGAVRR
jgi:MFS family permease